MSEVAAVMVPLKVTAIMSMPVTFTFGSVALDALLASQVARRDGLPEWRRGHPTDEIPVPPLKYADAGYYLASWAIPGPLVWSWTTHLHKPPPVDWYLRLCTDKVRRVDTGSGEDKAWRVPRHRQFFREIVWCCIGDEKQVRELLLGVTRIGSYRRDGIGKVRRWEVEQCETWDGFPVLRDGIPLRSLPPDYPGLDIDHRTGYAALRFPYWEPSHQELCALP